MGFLRALVKVFGPTQEDYQKAFRQSFSYCRVYRRRSDGYVRYQFSYGIVGLERAIANTVIIEEEHKSGLARYITLIATSRKGENVKSCSYTSRDTPPEGFEDVTEEFSLDRNLSYVDRVAKEFREA